MIVSPKRILKALRLALQPTVDGIYSEDVFKAILGHERAEAERNGHYVTVLAFYAGDGRIAMRTAEILGSVFADRLRATDIAGWLDSRTIGVMLPHTRIKNASLVAQQICHRLSAHGVRLDYKFYLYPHDECGKMDGQRDLPFPQSFGRVLSSGGQEGVSQFAARTEESSGAAGGSLQAAEAYPFEDICVAPLPPWKRVLDILWCLIGLVVFGPVMLLIAALIKIVSPGPVLFRQERIGYRGRPFVLFKFRSMHLNADTTVHREHLAQLMHANVKMAKLDRADKRLIPFGRLLRASGLDELPQLFNILRGDMSLIGPRPCVRYEYEHFSDWHKRRCDTYPGLTGLWQVSGKNRTTFVEMMRLDITYGRRQTLTKDLKILVKTVPAVLSQIREISAAKR